MTEYCSDCLEATEEAGCKDLCEYHANLAVDDEVMDRESLDRPGKPARGHRGSVAIGGKRGHLRWPEVDHPPGPVTVTKPDGTVEVWES